MAMTFDGQRSSCKSRGVYVEKIGWCAKEEVSSSFLGELAPSCLCRKHIPSIIFIPLLFWFECMFLSHANFIVMCASGNILGVGIFG